VETAQHAAAASGTLVLDRYSLVEELGSGGFGSVWLARDERLERPVAVKRVPIRNASPAAAERAEREALAAARLSHPAVVQLYEAGRDAEAVYLVSELVRGATLGDLLAEGALSDRDVLLIGMALCDALSHAHARGVVHRDVKPGNVLVPEGSADGVVAKLTDFGIARMSGDDALTATGDVVGTLAYMAPEQAEGRGATTSSDLYSLGLVLYEALTGVNPVRRATPAATARQVGEPLPQLRRMRRDLPRGLAAAIDAAVLPDADLRGSIDSLRLALAENLHDVGDEPGTVEAPADWATSVAHTRTQIARRWREPVVREEIEEDGVPVPRPRIGIPARLVHAALTAGLVPLLLALSSAKAPVTPAEGAALAAAVTVLLPRIGWILAAAALGGWVAHDDGSRGALIAVAAAPLPLLLFWRPTWWSAPGLAIGLGWLSVPGAYTAIAGQPRGIWTRAVLGAAGFWWISLAEIALHQRLLLGPAADLRDLVSSRWLVVGAVWAAAAALLPLFVRGRNVGADLLGALAWATATAVASDQLAKAVGAPDPRGLVGAAATAAVLAVLAQALRRT
jgi:hypothetical protein